ncbi:MAG: CD3072 family TudS-related putative desulfidase [Chloroflexota bacterium]
MERSIEDVRGGKIIFLSHCMLNQNAKVKGIAIYPGMIKPLVEVLLEKDIAVFQMPCPETSYYGSLRWGQVKDQYNTPMFRAHCRAIAERVLDQVEEYLRGGYEVLGFVMMDGSPVCGLRKTPQPDPLDSTWGGMTWYIPKQQFVDDSGVYCEILKDEVEKRGLSHIPFVSFPEVEDVGSEEDALSDIRTLLP